MTRALDLETLRHRLARLEQGRQPNRREMFSTGSHMLDRALGGGLALSGLHEVFAGTIADEPSAAAFALLLALRASGRKPIVWVRQDFVGLEMGDIYAPGLLELGFAPDRLLLVHTRDGPGVLRAGEEAARCASLGAVLIEPWGNPKMLDLVASRRLALAAERSSLPLLMVRAGGTPTPSAASTRWIISAAPSRPLDAGAPGHPRFVAELLKDPAGKAGRRWILDWNRDRLSFSIAEDRDAALSCRLATAASERSSAAPASGSERLAG